MGTSGNSDCQWASRSALKRLHRGCVDYLSWQFVPKWDSPNCESQVATARTASLLVELVGVAA